MKMDLVKTWPMRYLLAGACSVLIVSCGNTRVPEKVVPKVAPVIPKKVVKPIPKVTTPKYVQRTNPTSNLPTKSAAGVTHRSGSSSLPYVALTFDDGPHPTHTPKLLNTLKRYNVKATFYVTGTNAARYPHLVRRMVAEGHEVGNHTYTHPNLTTLSDAQVRSQIDRSITAISSATGVKPRTFRPPYGALTTRQRLWINSTYGYPIVFWSVDPKDWKDRNASTVTSRLVAGVKNGSILLLHDIHATSVAAVPQTINRILAKGHKFVTVSQLLGAK